MELHYSIAHNLRCQLPLRSGRKITLVSLNQWMTYAGLHMGTPSPDSNDRHIDRALREARRFCVAGAEPHLVEPDRRSYLHRPGDMERVSRRSESPEWLPMVTCVASFKDIRPIRDPKRKDLSVLTVVWFQEEYAMPISDLVWSQLTELDWESLASDIEV